MYIFLPIFLNLVKRLKSSPNQSSVSSLYVNSKKGLFISFLSIKTYNITDDSEENFRISYNLKEKEFTAVFVGNTNRKIKNMVISHQKTQGVLLIKCFGTNAMFASHFASCLATFKYDFRFKIACNNGM